MSGCVAYSEVPRILKCCLNMVVPGCVAPTALDFLLIFSQGSRPGLTSGRASGAGALQKNLLLIAGTMLK
jgi:hypothetical protein